MFQESNVATLPPIEEGQCSTAPIAKECNPKVKGIHPVREAWIHGIILQYDDLLQHNLTPTRQQTEHYYHARKLLGESICKRLEPRIHESLKEYNSINFTKKHGPNYDASSGKKRRQNKTGYKSRMCKPRSNESFSFDARILKEISNLSEIQKEEAMPWINLIESFGIFSYQVYNARNFADILVACIACLKMNVKDKCIAEMIMDLTSSFTNEDCDADFSQFQDAEEEHIPRAFEHEPTPFFLTDFSKKFSILKRNKNLNNINIVISGFASMIVSEFKGYKWTLGTFQILKVNPWCDMRDCSDFMEAVIKTIDYFWTTGYRCIKERSLEPLLFEDQTIQQFETDYTEVMTQKALAANGNLPEADKPIFQNKVRKLIEQCRRMKAISYDGWLGHELHLKLVELSKIDEKLIQSERSATLRITPFAISLFGDSSIGKSTLTTLLTKTALSAMGRIYDPERCVQLDMKSRFEDQARSDTDSIGFDDVANPKFGTVQFNHTVPMKKYVNPTEAIAEMSDVTQKSRVRPRPHFCWATTNKKTMDCELYSNCPESILRCFLHVTMVVNEPYRKKDSVMLNNKHPNLLHRDLHSPPDDVWTFTLEEVFTFKRTDGTTGYKFITYKGVTQDGKPVDCSAMKLSTFLEVISTAAAIHMKAETANLQYNNSLVKLKLCACGLLPGFCRCSSTPLSPKCSTCKRTPLMCLCALKEAERILKKKEDDTAIPRSFEIDKAVTGFVGQVATQYIGNFLLLGGREIPMIKKMATKKLAQTAQNMLLDKATPILLTIVPDFVVQNPKVQACITRAYGRRVTRDLSWHVSFFFRIMWLLHIILFFTFPVGLFVSSPIHMFISACFYIYKRCLINSMWTELSSRRDALPSAIVAFRDSRYGVSSVIFGVGAGITLLRLYKDYGRPRSSETDELSKEAIDAQPSWLDNMFGHKSLKVTTSDASKTAVLSQVEPILATALWGGTFHRNDGTKAVTSVVCLTKYVVVFPRHNFYKDANMKTEPYPCLTVSLQRHDDNTPGGTIRPFIAEFDSVYHFPGTDFVAAFVPNCPDAKDIRKWLPLGLPTGTADIKILWRSHKTKPFVEKSLATFGTQAHTQMSFPGCSFVSKHEVATQGSCSSMIIGAGKQPALLALFLGSKKERNKLSIHTGNWDCVAGTITRAQSDAAFAYLQSKFPLGASGGTLPKTQYGIEVLKTPRSHEKAHAGTFDATAGFEIYGSTAVRAQTKSRVIDSPLKPFVKEIFKPKVDFGPPQMNPNWVPYNTALDHAAKPEMIYPPILLKKAREDWIRPLLPLVDKHIASEGEVFRKLTLKEGIIGVPGKRFLDPLDMSTSMGFPVLGPKRPWFEEIVNDDGILVDRIPDASIIEEMKRIETCYDKGERAYPVMRACLKDEPTPIGKEKVRVFQSCPIAFSILVRQYFLPIIRFIGCHPRETECAVGINCFSPQWNELMTYAERFGVERTLAFDYSKYDLTCCSQITGETLSAMIELAKRGGYPSHHISRMLCMISDIVHPMIDWNGTLIQFFSMVISGINLTVQMNSIGNSFYLRMHFFSIYPKAMDFRNAQAVTTYGDDGYGTINEEYPLITFTSYQKWLAKFGKKITPPDKNAAATDYMPGADFLKRKSAYILEIGTRIGSLDEDSLYKSIMCNLESKVETPEDVARSSIASVMHEAFAFGRERYNWWQANLQEVCTRADILCPILDITFDERVEAWKDKYGSSVGSDP